MLEERVQQLERALAYLRGLPMISEHIAEIEKARAQEKAEADEAAAAQEAEAKEKQAEHDSREAAMAAAAKRREGPL